MSRIAIVDIDDELGTIEMINPEILETSGEQTGPEGCLSFPGFFGEVSRPFYVKVRAQTEKGERLHLKQRITLPGRFSMKLIICTGYYLLQR